jgi:hypothetical protein
VKLASFIIPPFGVISLTLFSNISGPYVACPAALGKRSWAGQDRAMPLSDLAIDELTIEDERSFRHVGLYAELKEALRRDGATFAVPPRGIAQLDAVTLLNLAFWRPGSTAEVLVDEVVAADQLMHAAWHHLAHRRLGADARSAAGLLLAEAIASAFDVYLVGRLLGHAAESSFLETQVPAMADVAMSAGCDEAGFEKLLERTSAEPEASFEDLRRLLFDVSIELAAAPDASAAADVLVEHADRPFYPLLHHFELPTWVLFARAYADPRASGEKAREVDRAMRAAPVGLDWLEQQWLGAESRRL